MGMDLAQKRAENEKIQQIIEQSSKLNKKPSPTGSPRAARIAKNRYQNSNPPYFPKTIYREALPIQRSTRFYGGVPRIN